MITSPAPIHVGGFFVFRGGDKMLVDKVIKSIPEWTNVDIEYLHRSGIEISNSQLRKFKRDFIKEMTDRLREAPVILVNETEDGPADRPLTDLRTINLPFKSFFIDANINTEDTQKSVGIFFTSDNISQVDNADFTVFIFMDAFPAVSIFLNKSKLPRMYILCNKTCENLNETGFITHGNIGRVCLKTERNASCGASVCSTIAIKLLIDVLHRFNDTEYEIVHIQEPARRKSTSPTESKKTYRNIIRLSKVKRVYGNRGGHGGTHASPTPHQRRGHYRHYKSGKVVWVRQANVGGKKPEKQTVYKL